MHSLKESLPATLRSPSDEKKLHRDIRQAAFDLLARREQSQQELRQKLLRKFSKRTDVDTAADILLLIDQVLQTIATEGLQSDDRYLEMLIRGRINQGYGPLRISQELKQKGIAVVEFQNLLDMQSKEWSQRARLAKQKKFGDSRAPDKKQMAKRMRFLQYRGFSTEQIRYALS